MTINRFLDKLLVNRLTLPYRPFYRQYPFRSAVTINSANDRGVVDLELGFFCNRIPKAANSTVVTNIARLKFGEEVPSKAAKRRFPTPGHLTREQVEAFPSLFRFAVVRNPYTRTLSAYLDKVERRALRANQESSFSDFVEQLSRNPRFLHSNAHWAPQSSLLLIPHETFDFVGKVESLDTDLQYIKSVLRPDLVDPNTAFTGNATGARDKLKRYYTAQSEKAIRQLFHYDFELFDYDPALPI